MINQAIKRINYKVIVLLILIIIFGSFLRFYGLKNRGFVDSDAAHYALSARTLPTAIHWFLKNFGQLREKKIGLFDLKHYLIEKGCIWPTGVAKPGFMTILTFGTFLMGSKDYTGFIIAALMGIFTIFLVFLIGQQFYNEKIALVSSFILAISGYHLIYSRSGLSVSYSLFLLTLGIYFYILESKKDERKPLNLFLCGLCLGFAFTGHYSLFPNLFLFFIYEVYYNFYPRLSEKRRLKTTLFLFSGILLPLISFEAIYRLVKLIMGSALTEFKALTYFEYLLYQFTRSTQGFINFHSFIHHDFLFYLYRLWILEGPIVTIILLLGLFYFFKNLIKKFSFLDFVLFSQVFFVLAIWSLNPSFNAARALASILSCLALITGKTIIDLTDRIKAGKILSVLIISGILIFGIYNTNKILRIKSSYKQAAEYIIEKGEREVVSLRNWPFWQFYLNQKIYARLDRIETIQDLISLCQNRKIRFFVVDRPGFEFYQDEITKAIREIIKKHKPVKIFPNDKIAVPQKLYEGRIADYTRQVIKNPQLQNIKIYDLKEISAKDNNNL